MNPIHEAGAASVMLLCAGGALLLVLSSLSAALRLARREGPAESTFLLVMCGAALVSLLSIATTLGMHGQIDDAVSGGGYGPPAEVRQRLAGEIAQWHASANGTAGIGCSLALVVVAIAWLPRWWQRRRKPGVAAAARAVLP